MPLTYWRALTFALLTFLASVAVPCLAAPFEDTMAQRTKACTTCHGDQGRAGPDGYYPRLAGKPAGYLYNQLLNIREGRRHYPLMSSLSEPLSNAYLMEIAQYFAGLSVAYPAPKPATAAADVLALGHTLVSQGDAQRGIPPCQQCHGKALTGAAPNVPGLLGLPLDYLNAQLGGWRTGQRHAQSPDCMAKIVSQLTTQDVAAVNNWLAAQPLPKDTKPLASLPALPAGAEEVRCGSAALVNPVAARKSAKSAKTANGARSATNENTDSTLPLMAQKGAYLALIGNCAACHTATGGAPYAGQRPIETPFGTAYSSNLTTDKVTGLGRWRADDFWQAMHHGKSRDGRLLNPAFPYTSYTHITRADSDAMFAYFQTVAPVNQPNRAQAILWPLGTPMALAAWRMLFFNPQVFVPEAAQSDAWNRGAYLVNGLGHCGSCHTPRDIFGAAQSDKALSGAMIPMQDWYAPSLVSTAEAGVDTSNLDATQKLLKSGQSALGNAGGPMAMVVKDSTQHLISTDLQAVLIYLQSLAQPRMAPISTGMLMPEPAKKTLAQSQRAKLYASYCADCHGTNGQGFVGAYPALAQNRAVLLANSSNLIQTVLHGGFAPVTADNPRPFGMPPFVLTLKDQDIAQVLTYIRSAWGNQAAPVTEQQVNRLRDGQIH